MAKERTGTSVGLDLSLTGAGLAIIPGDREKGHRLYRFGRKGKRNEPLEERYQRLVEITSSIEGELWHGGMPSIAMIEDMPFGAQGGSAFDRAGLWWMTYQTLYNLGIPVVKVNVAKVKTYATGKGSRVDKDEVMLAVARRYPDAPITNNDEADAFVLAAMGARLLGAPIEESLPQTHLRAMDGLELP